MTEIYTFDPYTCQNQSDFRVFRFNNQIMKMMEANLTRLAMHIPCFIIDTARNGSHPIGNMVYVRRF